MDQALLVDGSSNSGSPPFMVADVETAFEEARRVAFVSHSEIRRMPIGRYLDRRNGARARSSSRAFHAFGIRELDGGMPTHELMRWAEIDGRLELRYELPKGTRLDLVLKGEQSECHIVKGSSPRHEVVRGI